MRFLRENPEFSSAKLRFLQFLCIAERVTVSGVNSNAVFQYIHSGVWTAAPPSGYYPITSYYIVYFYIIFHEPVSFRLFNRNFL